MITRPSVQWQDLTTRDIAALVERDPVVVLPLAAIEQHGPHLPLSTDLEIAHGLLDDAIARVGAEATLSILPAVAVGTSREHRQFAGTLSLAPELLIETVCQLGAAVAETGVRRLVLFNAHGGNAGAIDTAALQLRNEWNLLVVKASYMTFSRPEVDLPESEWRHGLHGGAVETAMMRHLRPELVRDTQVARFASEAEALEETLNRLAPEGEAAWAWRAEDLHPSGAVGDASLGTAALGAALIAHYGQVLAEIFVDTAEFPVDQLT